MFFPFEYLRMNFPLEFYLKVIIQHFIIQHLIIQHLIIQHLIIQHLIILIIYYYSKITNKDSIALKQQIKIILKWEVININFQFDIQLRKK